MQRRLTTKKVTVGALVVLIYLYYWVGRVNQLDGTPPPSIWDTAASIFKDGCFLALYLLLAYLILQVFDNIVYGTLTKRWEGGGDDREPCDVLLIAQEWLLDFDNIKIVLLAFAVTLGASVALIWWWHARGTATPQDYLNAIRAIYAFQLIVVVGALRGLCAVARHLALSRDHHSARDHRSARGGQGDARRRIGAADRRGQGVFQEERRAAARGAVPDRRRRFRTRLGVPRRRQVPGAREGREGRRFRPDRLDRRRIVAPTHHHRAPVLPADANRAARDRPRRRNARVQRAIRPHVRELRVPAPAHHQHGLHHRRPRFFFFGCFGFFFFLGGSQASNRTHDRRGRRDRAR
ncbi:hypothetical protein CEUSTIGMA_g11916.t1 [Chlamydomonas eustigma]|uniref:Uncharacterized protein n=1 Tax=Chlamydomonas eustigma TaxID=1157962 RepID=A0A250XNA3_9CHLO|nr:hypothetical protein CEUSTIGMA_g11916.t1 [Chlamydomonas eustigma]|eukprot:GAX84496.1 hypothetical protein CEUSTIGMA_g11916.t1 [Chlamydomonas eustigma]